MTGKHHLPQTPYPGEKFIGVGICQVCKVGGLLLHKGHICPDCLKVKRENLAKKMLEPENEVRVATSWITLNGVHNRSKCCYEPCTIHNPSDHHMRYWDLHWRNDRGIFERTCAHGIGHPDPDQFPFWEKTDNMAEAVHGCDGCCQTIEVS